MMMTKKKKLWLALGALVVLGAAGASYYYYGGAGAGTGGKPGGEKKGFGMGNRPTVVNTATAKLGDMDVVVSALGTVMARNTVTVRPRVDGQLLRVAFREGQMVKAGELLAEIDPRPFQVVLDQANGQLTRDQAQLTNAVIDQQRYQMLLAKDSVSRQQLDTQDALVRQLQGAVQSDRAQVDSARLQLSFTRITAPVAGRTGLRQVDAGNLVRTTDSNGVVVITQTQPIDIVFAVPAEQLSAILEKMQSGEKLAVEAFDREGRVKLTTGKLASVDNQIDTATGTVKLKAEFDNVKNALFPNQFVNIRLKVETKKDAVLIPAAAVQRGTQGLFVYVVNGEEKTVALRPLTLGASTAETVAVSKGLAAGEVVVIDGLDKLRPGAKIETAATLREAAAKKEEGKPAAPEEAKKGERPAAESKPVEGKTPEGKAAEARPTKAEAPAAREGGKEANKDAGNAAKAAAPVGAATAPAAAAGTPGGGQRPEWFDRLPAEVKEKVKNMAPEERREYLRAWIQKRREERERQATAD